MPGENPDKDLKPIQCHGPCLVMFFLNNNQRMATSPIVLYHPYHQPAHRTYIGPLSEFILYSDTTSKSSFLSLPLPTAPHAIYCSITRASPCSTHVQCCRPIIPCTSLWGHGFQLPQGLLRIWVSTLWHPLEYEPFYNMFHFATICLFK